VTKKPSRVPSRRLPPAEREGEILRGAVAYFAEFGFEGPTRDLADRLGITQPLLYRYFPSKEALLDRVYQEVYLSRWDPAWEARLADRAVPLAQRLTRFYCDYARIILTYEWVRLFMFAGLKGLDFNTRYIGFLTRAVFERIVLEMRAEQGLPLAPPAREAEIELVWGLTLRSSISACVTGSTACQCRPTSTAILHSASTHSCMARRQPSGGTLPRPPA